MQFTRRARKEGNSLRLTIPPEIIDSYDVNPDDMVVLDLIKVVKK